MNINKKSKAGEPQHLELNELYGSLLHLLDVQTSAGLIQELMGKRHLSEENLELYLVILKSTQEFKSRDELYRFVKKGDYKHIKTKSKMFRASFNQLVKSELVSFTLEVGKPSKKKKPIRAEPPCVKYHQTFPHIVNNKLVFRRPENLDLIREDMICFLENFLYPPYIASLMPQGRDDELDNFIGKLSLEQVKPEIEKMLERLNIPIKMIHFPFQNKRIAGGIAK